MNQSELEANTCNRRQARENACEQVAIGLSFTSDWSQKEVKQNESKARITFDTQSTVPKKMATGTFTHNS